MMVTITPDSGDPIVMWDGSRANMIGGQRDAQFQFALDKNSLSGWYETPEVRETPLDRPQEDGAYWPSRLTQKPRIVTIRAHISQRKRSSRTQLLSVNDRLNSLVGRRCTLMVQDELGCRSADGYLSSQMSWETDLGFTELTLILSFPDPLKYGTQVAFTASGGAIRVRNDGNAPTWPSVAVSGHSTSLRLTLGDGEVRWQGDADGLALDFRDMIPDSGTVTVDRPFAIPPGESTVTVAVDSGASVSMTVKPAWR